MAFTPPSPDTLVEEDEFVPPSPDSYVDEANKPVVREVEPGSVPITDLFPAVRKIGGEIVPGQIGDTHPDIIRRESIPATDIDQRGFTTPWGDFLDRESAAQGTQLPTAFEPGRLHSTDLSKFQEGLEKPLEEAAAAEAPQPFIKLPEPSARPSPIAYAPVKAVFGQKGVDVTKSVFDTVYNTAKSVPEFLQTEEGMLAMLASATPLGRAGVEVYFTGDMIKSLWDQANSGVKDWDSLSTAQKASRITQAIATLGFTGFLAKAGIGTIKQAIKKPASLLSPTVPKSLLKPEVELPGAEDVTQRPTPEVASEPSPVAKTPEELQAFLDKAKVPAEVQAPADIATELGVETVGTSMGRDHYQFPTGKTEAGMEMDRVQVPAGSSIDVVRAAIETRKAQVAKDFSKEETASPMDFTPSLKTKEGKIIEGTPGGVHDDIYKAQGPLAGAELTLEEPEHGFLYKGEFKSREQAAKLLGETEPLRSERLNELRKQHLAKQAAAAQEPVSAGQLGGGAAELGEVGTGEGADIMGVRQVTREAQAKAGQPVVSQPGEGITTENSLDRGRKLLASDPAAADVALEEFDKTGRLSERDFGVARAKYEQVMEQGRRIEEKFGTDSPEYHAARMEALKWSDLTKRMQTEWHKQGMAQQGQTDIDTGNLMDLETARKTDTGKDFTPDQRKQAKKVAANSKAANVAADQARQKLYSEVAQTKSLAKAERDALAAASKTVRESAIRVAEAENKARVAAAGRAKEVADIEVKSAQKALKSAQNRARQAAVKLAKAEQKRMSDPAADLWERAKKYIDSGMDNFDDIRNKLATDTGMPVDRVTKLLTETKRAKYLADDMWRKQQIARQVRTQAKIWLQNLDTPFYQKAIASVPKILFGLKVGFHGSVALGTHAPMVAFQPKFWKMYVRDFGKMYKLIGNPAYYERQIQDLQRRPNYITANRSGLVNDPFVYEDYNSPDTAKYFGRLSGMGNRGYSILKILRQDMFDQHWNQLPRTAQIPEVAQALADGINHATGVVKGRAPRGTNIVFFAPRLEGSRVMWLAADPIRAANTFINWKKSNLGEKTFAINQVKEKAWVMGTMLSMLALNQGVLSAIGSKQKINFDDPFRSDFLKFKAAGMNMGYGNAMLAMARLPVRLYRIRERKTGRFKNLIYPDEDTYSVLGSYARSQLSPFAGLATELWLKADYENRPLPSSTRPVPKRLAERGVKPYTWAEFWSEQLTPIPVQEALKEVWEKGLGMNPEQIHQAEKAMATIAVMGATGARFTEDYPVRPRPMPRTFKEALEQE